MQLILDTCAALWISQDAALSRSAAEELDDAADRGRPVYVSPILGWEIGLLVARGRLSLPMTRQAWLARLMRAPNLRFADLPAHVFMESCFLPGAPPRDPADRIIIATAREFDLTIMTRDRLILAYAEAGHVRALEC